MEITRQQMEGILRNAPAGADKRKIVEGLINKGYSIQGLDTSSVQNDQRVVTETKGNQFQQPEQQSAVPAGRVDIRKPLAGIRDFAVGLVGGGKLAEGAGMGIAAPGIQKQQSDILDTQLETQSALIKRIREMKASGQDSSRLESALNTLSADIKIGADTSKDFVDALPTNKEVIGSAVRLGGTLAGGEIAKGAGALVGKATPGVISGAIQGAKVGALTGATEGAIQGGGIAAEQNQSGTGIALGTLGGGVGGAITGGVLGGAVGGLTGKLKANAALKAEQQKLLTERPDSRVAKYMIDGQGKISKDPVAVEAIKQGVGEDTTALIKGATPADRSVMTKALDILEKGKTDSRYRAVNRPSDVLGKSVVDRYKVVNTANTNAAKQLDGVAKSLRGQQVDPTPAVQSFISDLEDMGVTIKNGKANYAGSNLEGLTGPQSAINSIVKRMSTVSDDGYELHQLKKYIDETVNYGKTSGGLSGKTEAILKGLRHNLDSILDNSFPQYNTVNTQYATTRDVLDAFQSAAGSKIDLNGPNAEKALGTLARRILSNAGSRVEVLNTLQTLQDVAEANGGKFADDLVTQTVFVNDLEKLFGTSAPTSLAGETAKGVSQAIGLAGKLKSGTGLFDLAGQAVGAGLEKAQGINEENLVKALRTLLSS